MIVKPREIVIIGAGPAGVAVAIQLKRSGFDPIVFEKNQIGGLINDANLVENYPGFPCGIPGYELAELMRKQIEGFEVEIRKNEIREVEIVGEKFALASDDFDITAKILILATGTVPIKLPNLEHIGDSLFYGIKELEGITDKRIAIIGAGDAALDYALNLSKRNEVVILNRNREHKCLRLLFKRAILSERIDYRPNIHLDTVIRDSSGLALRCLHEEKVIDIRADYLLVAIGREQSLDFLGENLLFQKEKLEKMGLLYFIGDVVNGLYRQAAIAVGDGIRAAMEINRRFGSYPR